MSYGHAYVRTRRCALMGSLMGKPGRGEQNDHLGFKNMEEEKMIFFYDRRLRKLRIGDFSKGASGRRCVL